MRPVRNLRRNGDRRWEHPRVHPVRQRRLLASLAEVGRQTPIVVVAAEAHAHRYAVIDAYKRIAVLEQPGRDKDLFLSGLRCNGP
jgi:type II secretory pathway predicted ATPase ExeA